MKSKKMTKPAIGSYGLGPSELCSLLRLDEASAVDFRRLLDKDDAGDSWPRSGCIKRGEDETEAFKGG